LGVMDYYRLRNIQADTDMRTSIGGGPAAGNPGGNPPNPNPPAGR